MLTFSTKINKEQSRTSTPHIRLRDLHKKNFVSELIENCILGAVAKLQKSVYQVPHVGPSACPHGTTRLVLERFRKSVEKIQVSLISDKNNGILREVLCTFMVISRRFIFKMRNIADKFCRENNIYILLSIIFFRKFCR